MADPKTTAVTTGIAVGALIPQEHGGALRNGGTNKGGIGRPPNEYREWCQQAVWSEKVRRRIVDALENADPFPESLWAKVADRGFGKPVESIDMTGKVEHTLVIVHRRGE